MIHHHQDQKFTVYIYIYICVYLCIIHNHHSQKFSIRDRIEKNAW